MYKMKSKITFPTYQAMYPYISQQKWLKRARIFTRFYFSRLLCQKQIAQFLAYLNHQPIWYGIFSGNLYRFNALLSTYCDKRFNAQQRVEAIIANFTQAEKILSTSQWQAIIKQKSVILAPLAEDLNLHLNINEIDPFEGFFSINIQNTAGQRLYDASFSFTSNNQLLVASIQGPKSEDAQELVKKVTKTLHGIRPMFMLMTAFKLLAQAWQLDLVGIPHCAQAKYRWNDSSRLLFNYDQFWQENGAVQDASYWQIPLNIERKELEEIASKKRAMYRKRYEMLDNLQRDIMQFKQSFQPISQA